MRSIYFLVISCLSFAVFSADVNDQKTGSYTFKNEYFSNEIKILSLSKNEVVFSLLCQQITRGLNSGHVNGVASKIQLSSGLPPVFLFESPSDTGSCRVTIDFESTPIKVKAGGSCGFGQGVYCDGDYEKKSSETPSYFRDPRVG